MGNRIILAIEHKTTFNGNHPNTTVESTIDMSVPETDSVVVQDQMYGGRPQRSNLITKEKLRLIESFENNQCTSAQPIW